MVLIAYAAAWVHALRDHPRLCRRADDRAARGALLPAWPHDAFSVPAAFGMMPRFIWRAAFVGDRRQLRLHPVCDFRRPCARGLDYPALRRRRGLRDQCRGLPRLFASVAFLRTPDGFDRPARVGVRSSEILRMEWATSSDIEVFRPGPLMLYLLCDVDGGLSDVARNSRQHARERHSGHVGSALGGGTWSDIVGALACAWRNGEATSSFVLGPFSLSRSGSAPYADRAHRRRGRGDGSLWFRRRGAANGHGFAPANIGERRPSWPRDEHEFILQRLAGGVGTALIGSAAEQNGLRAPVLAAVALAFAGWCVAFGTRNGIAAAFRQTGLAPAKLSFNPEA